MKQDKGPPDCFGSLWDKNNAECAGGPDASFLPKAGEVHDGVDPQSGSHTRRQCDFYQSCGARVAATKNANGTLIPAQQIIRPPIVTLAPTVPQTLGQWLTNTQAQHQQMQQQAAMQQPRPPVQQIQVQVPVQQQQPQMFVGGSVQPATTWQLNYAMPPYLSQPETRHPGESLWAALLREVLRSMGKALGHAVSHFFDSRSLKEKQ
jgi:hypothetical protein